MELVDRYIQAVKFWLPREQKEDIARELSDDIRSEIEQAEREQGHPLSSAQLEALLQRRGRPFVIANQYLPQRRLIGPLLFPAYAFVLKLIGLVYVLPWIIVWSVLLTLAPSYRGHAGRDIATLWNMVAHIFAVVTLLFAAGDYFIGDPKALANWNPQRLPRFRDRDTGRISRVNSVAEIAVNAIFVVWWAGGFQAVYGLDVNSGTIWPEFHRTFFVPVIVLALIAIGNAAVSLGRPYWTAPRRLVRAFGNAAIAAIAGWTVRTHGHAVLAAFAGATRHNVPAAPPWAIGAFVDAGVLVALVVAFAASAITAVIEIYRAVKTLR